MRGCGWRLARHWNVLRAVGCAVGGVGPAGKPSACRVIRRLLPRRGVGMGALAGSPSARRANRRPLPRRSGGAWERTPAVHQRAA